LNELGLEVNDELLYKSREYRDDSVSCFSTEQESIVYITGLKLYQGRDRNVIIPLLSIKNKRGKLKPIKGVNLFLPYKLFKDGKLMFENEIEDIIIPNKYSSNEISDIRKRLKEIQKIRP